jgi:hypothetical protein
LKPNLAETLLPPLGIGFGVLLHTLCFALQNTSTMSAAQTSLEAVNGQAARAVEPVPESDGCEIINNGQQAEPDAGVTEVDTTEPVTEPVAAEAPTAEPTTVTEPVADALLPVAGDAPVTDEAHNANGHAAAADTTAEAAGEPTIEQAGAEAQPAAVAPAAAPSQGDENDNFKKRKRQSVELCAKARELMERKLAEGKVSDQSALQ